MNVERLRALRVRTPRLELRLATTGELVQLFEAAQRGIHPPEAMPFAVAWTDDLRLDAFLAYHRAAVEKWRASDWTLDLVTFLDGVPIGSQGLRGVDFGTSRIAGTGSWLERAHQGRGLGTEQRRAVLELAFSGLDAVAVTSGAVLSNVASRRVSEKLGYRATHEDTISPRGVPVPHVHLRLDRADHAVAADVLIENLEPALPLFGVA